MMRTIPSNYNLLTKFLMEYRKEKLVIPNGKFEYTIDTEGVVYNVTKGIALKGSMVTKNNRYVKVHIVKWFRLHRKVAEYFCEKGDGCDVVNHINGDRRDNRACNLEWTTHQNNMLHAYATGLSSNHGMKNPLRILTEEDVKRIWALRHTKMTAVQIRDHLKLPVGRTCVNLIRTGKNWPSVTSKLT